jgi:hypothetical protein
MPKDEWRARYNQRIRDGLCTNCGIRPSREGKRACQHCADASKRANKKTRADRVSSGLCSRCGKEPRFFGTVFCEACRERANEITTKHRKATKAEYVNQVLAHYGAYCACCGERNRLFLTIDHVNNDGFLHRKTVYSADLPRWLIDNNFPKGFQILCYNCNCGKNRNGGVCPHKTQEGSS